MAVRAVQTPKLGNALSVLVLSAHFLQVPLADLIQEEWGFRVRVRVSVPAQITPPARGPHIGVRETGVPLVIHDLERVGRRVHLLLLPVRGMAGLTALRPPRLV